MFNVQRVQDLTDQMTAITVTMAAIAEEQRQGILANKHDQIARMNAVLSGVMATQTQLVGLVGAVTATLIEYLLDQERQRDLGIT